MFAPSAGIWTVCTRRICDIRLKGTADGAQARQAGRSDPKTACYNPPLIGE
ncbi:hypothetical protein R54767_03918 [Paraburkholderia gardini]|uniref:Uncharacterized protein n=1 Tax=Paraburkholderia gardini TaxID=2823469 RepID=A0ABN7QUX1_9BURK|nr:hypothetical protein R54767_03918 [Paraburkholderia gardini]